jgi:hypothetical protein
MAGKIIADTIETGAGADISTSYVVNGSAKAWVQLDGSGTIAIKDDLNISSATDLGTGYYTFSITNAFSDSNYCLAASGDNSAQSRCFVHGTITDSSTIFLQAKRGDTGAFLDKDQLFGIMQGDLA